MTHGVLGTTIYTISPILITVKVPRRSITGISARPSDDRLDEAEVDKTKNLATASQPIASVR